MSKLSAVCTVNPPKSEVSHMDGALEVSFVPMADMGENTMYFEVKDTKRLQDVGDSYTYFKDDDVLVAKVTPCFENGKAGIAKRLHGGIGFGSSEFYVLRSHESTTPEWIISVPCHARVSSMGKTENDGYGWAPKGTPMDNRRVRDSLCRHWRPNAQSWPSWRRNGLPLNRPKGWQPKWSNESKAPSHGYGKADPDVAKPDHGNIPSAAGPARPAGTRPRCRGAEKNLGPWSRRRPPCSGITNQKGRAVVGPPL